MARISVMALNRMVEEQLAADETARQKFVKSGRALLSVGRSMSDDSLLSKLHTLHFAIDRIGLQQMVPRFASANDMVSALIQDQKIKTLEANEDWAWVALTCLWERWNPDVPNMEMVDDKMQAGYAKLNSGNLELACQLWSETWHAILSIVARLKIPTLDAFDEWFSGTQSVFNWMQDFEMELANAGIKNKDFFHERISLCSTMIDRFSKGTFSEIDFKSALATSYFEIDEQHKGEQLFKQYLDENPRWGLGWMSWSDVYFCFASPKNKDVAKAEQILKSGLAVAKVSDRQELLERLASLYEETDRPSNAADVRREIEQRKKHESTIQRPASGQQRTTLNPGGKGQPQDQVANFAALNGREGKLQNESRRTGRNDPCPCGSGKKFKKCCIYRNR